MEDKRSIPQLCLDVTQILLNYITRKEQGYYYLCHEISEQSLSDALSDAEAYLTKIRLSADIPYYEFWSDEKVFPIIHFVDTGIHIPEWASYNFIDGSYRNDVKKTETALNIKNLRNSWILPFMSQGNPSENVIKDRANGYTQLLHFVDPWRSEDNLSKEDVKYMRQKILRLFGEDEGCKAEREWVTRTGENMAKVAFAVGEDLRQDLITPDVLDALREYLKAIETAILENIETMDLVRTAIIHALRVRETRITLDDKAMKYHCDCYTILIQKMADILWSKSTNIVDIKKRESTFDAESVGPVAGLGNMFRGAVEKTKQIGAVINRNISSITNLTNTPIWAEIAGAKIDSMIAEVGEYALIRDSEYRADPVDIFVGKLPDFVRTFESSLLTVRESIEAAFQKLEGVTNIEDAFTIIRDATQGGAVKPDKNLGSYTRASINEYMIKSVFNSLQGMFNTSLQDLLNSGIPPVASLILHVFIKDVGAEQKFRHPKELVPGGSASFAKFRAQAKEVAIGIEKNGYNFISNSFPTKDINDAKGRIAEFDRSHDGPEQKVAREAYAMVVGSGIDALYKWRDYVSGLYRECGVYYNHVNSMLLRVYGEISRLYKIKQKSPYDWARFKQTFGDRQQQ